MDFGAYLSLDALVEISQIFSAIGVILSVIYLAIQIQTNTKAVKVSSYQQIVAGVREFALILLESKEAAEFYARATQDFEALTPAEQERASILFFSLLNNFQSHFYQYQQALLDQALWQAHVNNLSTLVNQPGIRAWWQHRQFSFTQDYQDFVEQLQHHPPH